MQTETGKPLKCMNWDILSRTMKLWNLGFGNRTGSLVDSEEFQVGSTKQSSHHMPVVLVLTWRKVEHRFLSKRL